jgi:probable F420-dependent oxidoreductase
MDKIKWRKAMPSHRPFRFGVATGNIASQEEWVIKARKIEDSGYDTLLVQDHVFVDFPPIAVLMTIADATKTLRLGSYVFNNDLRHPAVLFKEVAALDVFSKGRFEFGIGAGRMQFEYEQIGLPFEQAGIRVRRLEEAVHIVKQLFVNDLVTFTGNFYTLNNHRGLPRPVQLPHPPLLIGGGGMRLLSLAAREANIVGILVKGHADGSINHWEFSSAAIKQKVEWIRHAAGERFNSLELNQLHFEVVITNHRRDFAEQYAQKTGSTPEQVLENPYFLIGTKEQIIEELEQKRDLYGISYIVIFDTFIEAFAPIVSYLHGT